MKSASLIDKLSPAWRPDSTKTTLRSWIKQGRVTVDGKAVTQASRPVEENEEVKIHPKPKFTDKGDVQIVYQDRFLVAVDKPEGVLSVKAPFRAAKKPSTSILKKLLALKCAWSTASTRARPGCFYSRWKIKPTRG